MIFEPITDEEITAAEKVFLPEGVHFNEQRKQVIKCLETKDIKAAPGSGKTTALLSKIFILANRMPFKDQSGICVLTHTNVAIDEIKSKLGSKADILFKYPNFFGTFQSFVDKFLAIPYYAMVTKSRAVTIDERYYEEKMNKQVMSNIRGVKAQTIKNTRYFLIGNKLDPSKVRIQLEEGRRLLTLGLNGRKIEVNRPRRGIAKNFSMKEKEDIIDFLDRLKQKALLDGVLCYDDAYFLANRYLEKYGHLLKDLFFHRFKFVFVDEAQDTYSHQSAILESIFDDRVVLQKFGDPHQSIFGNKGAEEENSWTPYDGNCLNINDSQRFGVRIAQKLRRICADENHEIYGSNTVPSLKPHIILFNQSNSTHVLERFAELVYKNGLHMADESGKVGSIKAIGWRGNRTDNVTEKQCLNTYWPSYNKMASEIESTYHNTLCSYIKKISSNVGVQHSSKVYFDSIINAIIRFLYLADVRDTTSGRERHFHRNSLLKYLKNNHKDKYFQMQKLISEWVLKIHSHEDIYNNEVLEAIKNFLTIDLKSIWPEINLFRLTHFLESSDEALGKEQEVTTVGNQYISFNYPQIKIDINTVHAVKGETHRATLYLETFNYERDLKKLLPFLQGEYDARLAKQKRVQDALKVAYVGMSRPTHLLCLALKHEDINDGEIEKLFQNGWEIVQVEDINKEQHAVTVGEPIR